MPIAHKQSHKLSHYPDSPGANSICSRDVDLQALHSGETTWLLVHLLSLPFLRW